ncbi:putative zinc-binding metallopeptidase [Microbacterium sp. 2FI]|uniref:zinc-binding metallopeptidase family protein n=1 Tax=Microbacterium sp. 2FI TaxID=2502193 RepID=UPI0010F80A67|nr:putative zinc-binding metallopeptidase [Microbacterium sp. 2FI]
MKAYRCRVCSSPLYFENSICVSCGTGLGYSRAEREIVPVDRNGVYVDATGLIWHVCRNLNLSGCTWLAPLEGGQCFSCALTRTRPNDADVAGLVNFPIAERAKRHLIAELDHLGFVVAGRDAALGGDPVNGLCFDLLSSTDRSVTIGHDAGVVTIDLAESDPAYRERLRGELDEPYRTMLGHFRHEVGHYIQWQLVECAADGDLLSRSRALFGDETADYQTAIDRHYASGAPAGWELSHLTMYATMHPYEDFAETWAHYLHICDTVGTAAEYGLTAVAGVDAFSHFRDLVTGVWVPLSTALNMINRSMGKDDLYPFVIPAPVLDKLDFVASLRPAAGVA